MNISTKFRKQFVSFLRRDGFSVTGKHQVIERQLAKLMGSERYENYLDTGDALRAGTVTVSDLYQTMVTKEEFHLLFSYQVDVMIEVGAWLSGKVLGLETSAARISELGCGTGSLARWLADQLPSSEVIGIDRDAKMLAVALEESGGDGFYNWDYQLDEPDVSPDGQILPSRKRRGAQMLRRSKHY